MIKSTNRKRIGLLIELSREFGRDLCKGITEFAGERGDVDPVYLTPLELSQLRSPCSFDGFIARVMNDKLAEILACTGKPVVDVFYEKPHPGFAVVKTNHARVGSLAAEHFLSHRFTNFAFCGFADGRSSGYCLNGYRRALRKAGYDCAIYTPENNARYDFDSGALINEKLNRAPDAQALTNFLGALAKPVAVFCPNDLRAYQLIQLCHELKIEVPREVAILGLDNDPIVCGFSRPMISSIDPNSAEIGRVAAATLMEMIECKRPKIREIIRTVNPDKVITRASSETYPLNPPWLSDALIFINRHFHETMSAVDVCNYLGLSHTSVSDAFRRVLGTTVQKEIVALRLSRACRLLNTTELGAADIAKECGFASVTYFTKTFTDAMGLPPIAYRNRERRADVNKMI